MKKYQFNKKNKWNSNNRYKKSRLSKFKLKRKYLQLKWKIIIVKHKKMSNRNNNRKWKSKKLSQLPKTRKILPLLLLLLPLKIIARLNQKQNLLHRNQKQQQQKLQLISKSLKLRQSLANNLKDKRTNSPTQHKLRKIRLKVDPITTTTTKMAILLEESQQLKVKTVVIQEFEKINYDVLKWSKNIKPIEIMKIMKN